jgi:hypothetical protein
VECLWVIKDIPIVLIYIHTADHYEGLGSFVADRRNKSTDLSRVEQANASLV